MSEKAFEKLWDLVASFSAMWQLLVAIFWLTGTILFNIFLVNDIFEMQTAVDEYKVWVFMAFFISGAVLVLKLAEFLWKMTSQLTGKFSSWRVARFHKLNTGCQILLQIMASRSPDATSLLNGHPDVRTLRKDRLVERYFSFDLGAMGHEYDDYVLSAHGQRAEKYCNSKAFQQEADENFLAYIKTVTGMERQPNSFVKLD